MGFIVFICVLIGIILFAMVKGTVEEGKRRKAYRDYLIRQYGTYPLKKYSIEDYNRIAKRYVYQTRNMSPDEKKKYAFLDDITWNDLELDKVYADMNATQSAAGAEYLYMMLHMLHLTGDKLEALEEHIRYFDQNKELRVRIQERCHELGNTGKYSIYDYILYLTGARKEKKGKHIVMCLTFLFSIGLLLWNTTLGIVCIIVSACVNVLSYLDTKRKIIPYLTGISYIRRLLEASDNLIAERREDAPEDIQKLFCELKECTKGFQKFRKHAFYVSGMNAGSGNPIQLITDYLRMFTHIDLIHYQLMLEELQKRKEEIVRILDMIGYVDAVIAIASYRHSGKVWSIPVLEEDASGIRIEGAVHPLLKDPVANDYVGKRGMLITGSNASGKSTFLKTIALNAVLAQTIHTVTASSYEAGYYRIYSSMALRDSISGGDSYYMVEIKALKRIMDAATDQTVKAPLLCFVDEVLRGTNTVERIAASTQILKQLAEKHIYCFAATHDVELTYLLEQYYDNYHFREDMDGKDVVFSYKLLQGRATTRNAIKLLNQLGFDEKIITQAEELAAKFMETNQWV